MRAPMLATAVAALVVGGCSLAPGSLAPSLPIQTGAVSPAAPAKAGTPATRGTPVVAGRPARVYVMAGFKEADCSLVTPQLKVSKPPAQGTITFQPNQKTFIQHSQSGKCTGKEMAGTGIYYTAKPGAKGEDSFEIMASTGTGQPMAKAFQVRVLDTATASNGIARD